jgi:glycosyltransferase involved in cell wall biosynthesis
MPFPAGGSAGNSPKGRPDVLFFGTFDDRLHPRTEVLREGLEATGFPVSVVNRPLGLSTADKVRMARFPPRAILLITKLLKRWIQLLVQSRGMNPAVVIVGYMGHFDVHLARLRFPSSFLVLDHLTGLAETAVDRRVNRRLRGRILGFLDSSALDRADLVLTDTEEQAARISKHTAEIVVVPVGATTAWHEAALSSAPSKGALTVVFVGLFTPLQGAEIIAAAAVQALEEAALEFTFVGTGQDLQAAKSILGSTAEGVSWLDWVPSDDLPSFVAAFDVSLGIFGTSPKALRVVPNKVYQGLAAGTVVITSDTPPQRRLKSQHELRRLRLVPPGDSTALGNELVELAREKRRSGVIVQAGLVDDRLTPAWAIAPLAARLCP